MKRVLLVTIWLGTAAAFAQSPDVPDGPGQPVARLSIAGADVSVRHGGSGEWSAALLNAPLLAGDAVSTGRGGRAELQLDGGNFVRIGNDTEVRISEFENGHVQLQLARGIVTYRVLRDTNLDVEISTPSVAVHPLRQSTVRVEMMPDGTTETSVRRGEAEVSSQRGTERLREGRMLDPDFQNVSARGRDSWDGWNDDRDRYLLGAQSTRYVSPDVFGAEDLDAYGRWDNDPSYGDVWTPVVSAGWSPYQNGQWVWQEFYGWTWVESSPWGWAPFHYGSWYRRAGFGWSWFPGRRSERTWWRPGMVAFIGFGDGFSNVGWVPLAPFERYRPWYGAGRGYRGGGGVNVIGSYRNASFATSVSRGDFERGIFRNHAGVSGAQLQRGSVVQGALPMTHANPVGVVRDNSGNQRFYSRNSPQVVRPDRQVRDQQATGWSRFGAPSGPQVQPRRERIQQPERERTQQPQREQRIPQPQRERIQQDRADVPSSWSRFGTPARDNPGRDSQRQPQMPSAPQFERPSFAPQQRQQAAPDRGGFARPSRSLDVAPPLIRQRDASPSRQSIDRGGERQRGGPARDTPDNRK